jgi:hypothetical protein
MFWDKDQHVQLTSIMHDIEYNIMDHYQGTDWYNSHGDIDVPVLGFQFEIAQAVAQQIDPGLVDRVEKIRQDFTKSRAS